MSPYRMATGIMTRRLRVSRNNLAYAYQEAGRPDDAIPLYDRTLTTCERVLGDKHPLTQNVRDNLRRARDQT